MTREGQRLVGHNTDVAGFKVALDKLVGRQKMPRQAVVLGAGGGARAVVYGLIREGFQRIVVFNRHLHRAEGLVKHFGRSAAHMELRAMPWHESIIESELAKTKVLVNATSIGLTSDVEPAARPRSSTDELLVLDLIYARTRLLREAAAAGAHRRRRRADAAPPGRRGVHAVDRPAGAARAHAERLEAAPEASLGRGRAGGSGATGDDRRRRDAASDARREPSDRFPLPHRRRVARAGAGRRRSRACRPASP